MKLLPLLLSLLLALPALAQSAAVPLTPDNAAQVVQIARLGRGVIREAVWSPDGTQIAVASTIGVWRYDANALDDEPRLLDGQTGASSVAFSPDNLTLVSGGDDGSVVLWDAASADMRLRLESHLYPVTQVAFSPDGALLASADTSGILRLWDALTGAEQQVIQGSGSIAVMFSPHIARTAVSGTQIRLLITDPAGGQLRVWDTDGSEPQAVTGFSAPIMGVAFNADGTTITMESAPPTAFSPDGLLLAEGRIDSVISLRQASTGHEVGTLHGHIRMVTSVAFSPDSRLLASASLDGTVRLWNVETREQLAVLEGHTGGVTGVAFSPDGTHIASSSYDGTIRLWSIP